MTPPDPRVLAASIRDREPIEPSEYGWTLIARGEHIDDGRACLDGAVHAPEDAP